MVRPNKIHKMKQGPNSTFALPSPSDARNMSPRRGTISNLPNELLVRIFRETQQLCAEAADFGWYCPELSRAGKDRQWAKWLAPARVCRRWYSIIVNCPALWTTIRQICLCTPDVLEAILARSNGLPLSVDVDDISDPITRKTLLRQMRRIRHLKLESYRTALDIHQLTTRDLYPDLYRPDILETLLLDVRDMPFSEPYHAFSLSQIFHGDLPHLREFTFFCDTDMDGVIPAPNLRSLVITVCEDDRAEDVDPMICQPRCSINNIQNLLESLLKMPHLEQLELQDPCSTTLQAVDESIGIVSLPSLKSFRLANSAGGAVPLLRHISLPPACDNVEIELSRDTGAPSHLPTLVTAIGSCLGRLTRDSSYLEPLGLLFGGVPSSASFDFYLPGPPPDPLHMLLRVRLHGDDRPGASDAESAVKLLAVMPFAPNVTCVSLCGVGCRFPVVSSSPEVQGRLFRELARYREVRRLDIFPRSLPLPVSPEEVREAFPHVQEATYHSKEGFEVLSRSYTYAVLPTDGSRS